MENTKILVFDNPDDFLIFMDCLQKDYNKKKEAVKNNINVNVNGVNHEK